MGSIKQLYKKHRGKISDKWSSYLEVYERIFSPFREKPIRLLEIGVQNGGSLEIWSEYFTRAKRIVGCDTDPKCSRLQFKDDRIRIIIGDANSDECERKILQQAKAFEIIIDDGSHTSSDVVRSFARYFAYLSDGGIYVVEDLHASYWEDFGGGLHNPSSAMAFFKRLADIINYEHWRNRNTRMRRDLLKWFEMKLGIEFDEFVLARIHSIEFINSLCIVRKLPPEKNILGRRIVSGKKEYVTSGWKKLHGTSIQDLASQFKDDSDLDVFMLSGQLERARAELANREARLNAIEAERSSLSDQLERARAELAIIKDSFGYSIMRFYTRILHALLPDGTRRGGLRKIAVLSLHMARKEGIKSLLRKAFEKIRRREFKITEPPPTLPLHRPNVPTLDLPEVAEERITPYEDSTVSVVIPTKNAGEDFEVLLYTLKSQEGLKSLEIIVVDSGSSDNTLEIAKRYGAKIIQIPPESFSHSYSRNLGAENATGKYIFFTVQDALPPSKLFLHELLSVLKNNGVVAVSCAEMPREDSDLFFRVINWNHYYKFLELNRGDRVLSMPKKENYETLRKNGQISDIALLIYRDVFMKYKYRNDYAEDLYLGIRLIRDCYKLALLDTVRIIHSHNRHAYYFLKRFYVDTMHLAKMFPDFPSPPPLKMEDLAKDIILTYNVLNLILDKISNIETPCDLKRLKVVAGNLESIKNSESYMPDNIIRNQYIDGDFWLFLKEVFNKYYVKRDNALYRGVLINAMLGFLHTTFDYMEGVYRLIDDYVLSDFKTCIFKGFALICGAHLAFCYLNSSNSERLRLKEIHDELSRGI